MFIWDTIDAQSPTKSRRSPFHVALSAHFIAMPPGHCPSLLPNQFPKDIPKGEPNQPSNASRKHKHNDDTNGVSLGEPKLEAASDDQHGRTAAEPIDYVC